MKITALDIRKQEFARTFRGYDADEVDSFLQVIATGWQEMVDDLRRSQEKIDEQQMKLEHYMKVEEALEEALQTARSSARQTIESAEKKATDMLEDAENRIVQLQKEADANRLDIKRETARYAVRQQEIVAKLRAFLVSEMEMLRHFEADTGERTLQQPSSRREIEMYRDEDAGEPAPSDVTEAHSRSEMDTSGETEGHSPGGTGEEYADLAEEESRASEAMVEDSGMPESDGHRFGSEVSSNEKLEAESNYESAGEDSGEGDEYHDDYWENEAAETEDGSGTEEIHAESEVDPVESDADTEGAPGWRITPVFESASDGEEDDVGVSDLDALPDDGADDEIKKIHEILKGLDEEQDADDE